MSDQIKDLFYVIFFVTPAVFKTDLHSELDAQMKNDLIYLAILVFICTVIMFLLIWCITINLAKKITNPIQRLTEFTNELISKKNMNEKREVIERIKNDPLFKHVATSAKTEE